MAYRIIVADPTPVVRAGLRSFFAESEAQIVDEAQTCEQIIAKTSAESPDLLLLDSQFPDGWGFDAIALLRGSGYVGRVVFYSNVDRQSFFARALAVGADSYLLKKIAKADLLQAVTTLLSAKTTRNLRDPEEFSPFPGELKRVSSAMCRAPLRAFDPLTKRETQVLRNIALGLSNKEIASVLQLSLDTVKEHVQRILGKLQANDRTQAAVWAIRNKLIN